MTDIRRSPGTLAALVAVILAAPAARSAEPSHSVGLAAIDITPATPIRLNGFAARKGESQGVRLPIHARAMALAPLAAAEPGAPPAADAVVVIVVETLGIPHDLTERLAARLAAHGLARSRLAICATHTHSAPMIRDCANTLYGHPLAAAEWGRILAYSAAARGWP